MNNKIYLNVEYLPGRDNTEVYICCPFAHRHPKGKADIGFKMGLNIKTGVYHCTYCGAKPSETGPIQKVLDLRIEEPPPPDIQEMKDRLFAKKKSEITTYDLEEISWPLTPERPIAYKYMKGRGFSDEEMKKYHIRVGKDWKWAGRIMFPLIIDGKCRYIVGRSYAGREPRYYNTSIAKTNFLYGFDEIEGSQVLLTEGIISGIAASRTVGLPFVCMLGKTLSKAQISKLRSKVTRVYVTLDGGGVQKHEKFRILQQLFKAGFEVYNINLPENKDPDDLGAEFKKYFDESQIISKVLVV